MATEPREPDTSVAATPAEGDTVLGEPTAAAASEWAKDGELADEIVLYGEVVVAASESDDDLTQREIDTALGLENPTQV